MAVEVAADVVDGDQVGKLPGVPRLDLAAALAQLGLDVGKAEQLVDAGLLREAMDLLALDLGHAVLADRVPALERPLAELDVVLRRAGEVLEQVTEGLLGADPKIDLEAGMGEHAGGDVPAAARVSAERPCVASASTRPAASSVVAIRSRSLQVSVQRRAEPAISIRFATPSSIRSRADLLRDRQHVREQQALADAVLGDPLERGEDVLLGLRAEAAHPADAGPARPPP